MIHKQYCFLSGLPRSGSTLLANILAQNPRFHASATSGILDVIFGVRNHWDQLAPFQAMIDRDASEAAKRRVLRGILESYYADDPRPVVFDKSRSWLAHLELAEAILGRRARVLVPVRDIREVLASFERLWRKASATRQIPQESQFYVEFQSIEGRCAVWARGDQPLGLACNRIRDALMRGFRDRLLFVPYESLTAAPAMTMAQIYEFLGEEPFAHDFENVVQVTHEDDRAYGFADLHSIRARVEPTPPHWPKVLGEAAALYANVRFW
ncbi:sulfotransferase [Singulisphaera sp. GP187]|uniref:sulfotransferase family protein n=1 Tax=Singulisphaera sp. GP187 TaxID=1882752 RepID=UPI00092CD821|nr:sulfotransferase [Singulisphaera sp. GP187]SIO60666.1 sulfotransferase [Singulisphaera sp. GP187]